MTTINKKLRSDGQKQAVQNTQTSLQLLPLIMNNIPQAVFWKDRDLVYLGCNQAFADDAGFSSSEEVIGKTDFDMPWKDQAELYRADDRRVLENGESKLNYEEPQTTPAGATIWLRTSKIPVYENDQVVAILGMYEDITAYKKIQEVSESEKQRFQTILETVRVPTIISRLSDGIVLYANQAIAQVSQVKLEKLVGFKTGNFYANPEDQDKIRSALRQYGHIDDFEVQFRRTDGSLYWALLSSRMVSYEGENCVLSSYVDITERKQAEEALRESEARYSAVVTQAKDGVVIIQDNILQFVNDAMGDMLGYPASELVNTPIINYIAPESRELIVNRIKARLAGQEVPALYEAKLLRKDGMLIDAELSAGVIEYRGKPADVGMIRDVTERKHAEKVSEALHEFSEKQSSVFAELARSERLYTGDIQAAFAEVTEAAARTLNIQRSSIWYYNEDRTEIRCMDLFEQGKGHSEGIVLSKADFPSYFKALEDEKVIAAENAHTDPATHEFSASYLTPLGINSMLDAPIRLRGRVIGVICNEHVGPFHQWTTEEKNFAGTIVDFITVAVETQERKQAEVAVHESEERFRRFTEATGEGLVFHEQGKIIDANPAGLAMFGLKESSDFIGRNLLEFVLPEFRQLIVDKMQLEDVPSYEVKCIRADGAIFPVETSTRTYQTGERIIRATSIRDITERKQAETELQQEKVLSDAIINGLPGVFYLFDTQGKMFRWNKQYEQMMGFTPEEAATTNAIDAFADEDKERVMTAIQRVFVEKQATVEANFLTKDGRRIPHYLTGQVLQIGDQVYLAGTGIDITERKRLEDQVQEAFERRGLQVQLSTQVSQSIATAPSLEELYPRVVTQVKEQFGYYHTQILRYDAAQEAVVLVTGYGEVGTKMLAAGHRLPMGEGLIGTAAGTGETVLRSVLENDPDWHPNPLLPETKGEIAVPIKLGDTILGVLDVQSSVAGALDADDQLLLEGLCGQIATAIEGTRLRQEMAERLEEISRLYRAMSHEGWQTYREKAEIPSSFMFDQGGLRPVKDSGLAEELFASIPLTVPGGEVIGSLGVADDPQRPITSEDQAFLQQVSEQVALALESARLFEQTEQQRGELNEALVIAKLANWEYDVNRDRFIFNDHFYSIFHTTV
ncbi:MAG: PAS domain S-box protein, partial [Chloroflexi bacterium]